MENPETRKHWTHKTQDEDKENKEHITTQNIKKMSNTDPTRKPSVNPVAREG